MFHSSGLALALWTAPKTATEKVKEGMGLSGHMDQLQEASAGEGARGVGVSGTRAQVSGLANTWG